MFLLTAISMVLAGNQSYAKALSQAGQAPVVAKVHAIILVQAERAAALMKYTVLPGNTLSGIARSSCGHANEWTGIYEASRKVVGRNPDLIFPGQVLTINCTNKPVLMASHPSRPAHSGTYGHPYYCGDGDGDGWDLSCQGNSAPKANNDVSKSPARLVSIGSTSSTHGCSDPSGQLTSSQVDMIWRCAGGPSWAAGAALAISWCESGWNTKAYNPSGASGLFQILGEVVGGNIFDAHINALNAVSKFSASGDTWAQWVCKV
jgi:LysM repeat protein